VLLPAPAAAFLYGVFPLDGVCTVGPSCESLPWLFTSEIHGGTQQEALASQRKLRNAPGLRRRLEGM